MYAAAPRTAVNWLWRKTSDPESQKAANAAVSSLEPAVVVTGGSSGIGFAIARRFLKAGHSVALVARNAEEMQHAWEKLPAEKRGRCITIVCDVAARDAFNIIEQALKERGYFTNVLVNSAAMGLSGPFTGHDPDELARLIDLNTTALTRLTREALPAMIARGRGGILNIASLGAYVPGPNQAAYYASKAYVLSLTEAIAWETGGTGVTVSCVAPGPVGTGFHAAMGAARAPYRYLLPELSVERVANSAYRGFRFGQHVIIPGLFNRVMFVALRLLPHPITVAITGWLLKNPPAR